MKKILNIALASMLVLGMGACHEPEYVLPNESASKGILSIKAIIPGGLYANQVLATLNNEDPDATYYKLEIPWYYPVTSDNTTESFITDLRIEANVAPNYRIEPGLGKLDLTEEHSFMLVKPDGSKTPIIITGERVKPKDCALITFSVPALGADGVINEEKKEVLLPYLDEPKPYAVTGEVSPHATISMVGDEAYSPDVEYDLSDGQTVTVLAGDGITKSVYTLMQGNPELIDDGININSWKMLFNADPVSMYGLPKYNEKAYISIAGLGSNIVVCTGSDRAPVLVNRFNGAPQGTLNVGPAVVDVVATDGADHLLLANYAYSGKEVNLYISTDVTAEPTLLATFNNPLDYKTGPGIGHRMKVIGNVDEEAVVVFTAEGIAGSTTASRIAYVKIKNRSLDGAPQSVDFTPCSLAWNSAPVGFATVAAASVNPEEDGWFLDYYDGNSVNGSYALHHVDKNMKNTNVGLYGDWGSNPNCLDVKTFNHSNFLVLLLVSHFPHWGYGPKIYFFDSSSYTTLVPLKEELSIPWGQTSDTGFAAGDVCLCPTADGTKMYLYYYDHNSQSMGAYVMDCIKK